LALSYPRVACRGNFPTTIWRHTALRSELKLLSSSRVSSTNKAQQAYSLVHPRRSRQRATSRDPCRHVRTSCRPEDSCQKSFLIRFLLAHRSG
jgi:hypothetical protein